MNNNFCTGCKGEQQPPCAIKNIINGITLNDVISKTKISPSKYLVCHRNAIKLEDDSIIISEKCDSCGLCKISCCKQLSKEYDKMIESPIFAELGKLNIFLTDIFPEAFVATEVKAEGNFRQKRIDAVVLKEDTITFIKILTNLDKYNFYHRSYEEIKNECTNKYPKINTDILFIVPEAKLNKAKSLGYDVICINEIRTRI